MGDMALKEVNNQWDVSLRWINHCCSGGRIPGAVKMAGVWLVPKNAEKMVG